MAAVDDLAELVERAAAAEKIALASKWKDAADVRALVGRLRRTAEEQRRDISLASDAGGLSPRWARLRQGYLDLGAQPVLPGLEPSAQDGQYGRADAPRRLSHPAAAQAERDAVAAVGVAKIALIDAALAVLQARLARIQAGCLSTWVLMTVFAVALAQQPKVRRRLEKEIGDYNSNAEAPVFAAQQAAAAATSPPGQTST